MGASYQLIRSNEIDSTLIDAWRSIQAKSSVFGSPYFCPEFTQLVASVRDDVRLVVIEDGGRPVGFFPHQRSFAGIGKPVGGPLSDYHGVIAEAASDWNVRGLLHSAKLSVWSFNHLVQEHRKLEPYVRAHAVSPQIDLREGFEHYMRQLRHPPQDFLRKSRRLERECGELTFSLHDASTGPVNQLIAWKRQQYRRARLVDVFDAPWTGELLRRVLKVQTADFAGVCSVLRSGDKVVAVHAGMRSRHTLHWWFPAYDQEFSRYSPGIILLFRMAETLAGSGIHIIDLGKGEEPYKLRVMNASEQLGEGFVERPSLLASARRVRRSAEARAARGGIGRLLRLPLKVIRKIEWRRKFI